MKKILVVDDEIIIRKSCERALTPEGFEVVSVASGHEALEILEKGSFPVVLLDLKMPDMDGIEVLKKITTDWPGTRVIMITGYSTADTVEQVLNLGAYSHIKKPFTPDALLASVRNALKTTL